MQEALAKVKFCRITEPSLDKINKEVKQEVDIRWVAKMQVYTTKLKITYRMWLMFRAADGQADQVFEV